MSVEFRPHFKAALDDAHARGKMAPSKQYLYAGDLCEYGYDVRLHMVSRYGRKALDQNGMDTGRTIASNKIEIYDTGDKTYGGMLAELEAVLDCDPKKLEVTRLDLCADVKDVPVQWFIQNSRVEHKRVIREIGYMRVAKGTAETFYAGKKPNQFRVYNKTAERMEQLRREHLHVSDGAEKMNFEERWGYSPFRTVTRVERQIGGHSITTMGRLVHLERVRPFDKLHIIKPTSTPQRREYGATEWLAGQHLRDYTERNGMMATRALMREMYGNNTAKMWDRFLPFITEKGSAGPDGETLQTLYLSSLYRQMSA